MADHHDEGYRPVPEAHELGIDGDDIPDAEPAPEQEDRDADG